MDTTRATGVAQVLVSAARPVREQSQHATATKTLPAPSAVLLQYLPLQCNIPFGPFPRQREQQGEFTVAPDAYVKIDPLSRICNWQLT